MPTVNTREDCQSESEHTDAHIQAREHENLRGLSSNLELTMRITLISLLDDYSKYFERTGCLETHRTVASHSSHSPIIS